MPSEFLGPRELDHCGVIAIWGRPYRPPPNEKPRIVAPSEASTRVDAMIAAGTVYTDQAVDVEAKLVDSTLSLVYPNSIDKAVTRGFVRVEFVVDPSGALDWKTFSVVSSTHRLFSNAVRDGLVNAVFAPAIRAGRNVGQVFHLPVEFVWTPDTERPSASASATRPAESSSLSSPGNPAVSQLPATHTVERG